MDPLLEDLSEGWVDLLRESVTEPIIMELDPEDTAAS
jgi:hypothetical protein